MERFVKGRIDASQLLSKKSINSILAYTASCTLSGVPPEVCESALINLFQSVKKSRNQLIAFNLFGNTQAQQRA